MLSNKCFVAVIIITIDWLVAIVSRKVNGLKVKKIYYLKCVSIVPCICNKIWIITV